MSLSMDKPFYFQPPWNILFELHRLQKVMPWNVNISFLLTSFLEEMEKRGEINFRASGVALDSSATIYLMKSKLLLELEDPPPPPKAPPDFLPPPIILPLRYELSSTTVHHLLKVLDEVLKGEHFTPPKTRMEPVLPTKEVLPPVDLYLMEIEERMKDLYSFLCKLASEAKLIIFSKVVAGFGKLEAVKTFIILLFLAQKGRVNLWQEEDFSELHIIVAGNPTVGGKETGII